jgi:hypothetical protein
MIAAVAAAALLAGSASYDCTLEPPRALGGAPGEERSTPIGIPDLGPLRFQIRLTEQRGGGIEADVRWPGNPLGIAGRTAALATGEGAVAFVAMSAGPCLFTERACLTLVSLVDETPESARIVLMPSALTTIENGQRRPFTVLLSGTCTRSESDR